MATIEEKKKFALEQIKPYVKDRSLCGINDNGNCQYWTEEGKMCVAGKNMINPKFFKNDTTSIECLINEKGEKRILKPESRNILSASEWGYLQNIHDHLSSAPTFHDLSTLCRRIGLFTNEELMEG